MNNIKPHNFQMECAQRVYDKICEGKRNITILVPNGSGKTIISLLIAEKVCTSYQKALIVADRAEIVASCNGMIEQYGAKSIECISIDEVINKQIVVDLFILYSLRPLSRKRMKEYFDNKVGTIVISIGEPLFEKHTNSVDYVVNMNGTDLLIEEKKDVSSSLARLVEYYRKLGNIQPLVYSTESIIDIRDIISADNDEKKLLSEQIRNDRNRMAHEVVQLSNIVIDPQYEDLKIIVEKQQRKLDYYEQLLACCGIPKDTLDKEFEDIERLREELKDDFYNSDGSINEVVMSQFETAVAESVVRCTRHVLTLENRDIYVDILKDLVSEDVWENKLCEESKSFLITAKMNYEAMMGMENKEELEYSGVCLLVTKALDVEISRRIYDGYVDYLKKKFPCSNSLNSWPNTMLNKEHSDVLESKDFTLGTVKFAVGINEHGSVVNNYVYRIFKQYAKDELYNRSVSDSVRLEKIKNMVSSVEKVRVDYRNPSAHRNALDYITAEACMDYMLETYKKLKEILEDMR